MKILAIADVESSYFWDFYDKEKFADIDLILSAGDLDPDYLSFLVTLSGAPVLYVHGNHDEYYSEKPPEGCICIDDMIYNFNGIRIFGLGGSMQYRDGNYQYTEKQMRMRVWKKTPALLYHKGFDILLTHAPAKNVNDSPDLPHQGFQIFCDLMDRFGPRYFIHGHVHKSYSHCFNRYDRYKNTTVINAYEYCTFLYDDPGRHE